MSDSVKNEIHGWVTDARACGAGAVAERVREGAVADLEALPQMLAWKAEGRDCLLATVAQAAPELSLPVGSRLAVSGEGRMSGQLGGSGLEAWVDEILPTALSKGESRLVHLGRDEDGFWAEVPTPAPEGVSLLVEAFPAPLEVVIFGAGAVSMKLGELCAVMGIPFRVCDDRPEAADPARFPAARSVHCLPFSEALESIPLGVHSHCVVMTAGHTHDADIAASLLQRPHIPYVGVMHNPKKALTLGKDILARGAVPDKRFYCPVGLGIGWGGIAAIAIAELAEIVALQSDCSTDHNTLDWDAFVREQG
jgi:xanthine dehydrogenase accessory factor